MASLNGVNTNAEPSGDFEPLPIGDYPAVITKDEVKSAKSGNGDYLSLSIKVIDGQYKNRTLFTILNLWNANPKAKEIAERELAAIKAAVGVTDLRDTSQLHNKPLIVRLGIDSSPGYEPKNKITGWKPIASVPTAGGNLAKATPPTSSPTSSAPTKEFDPSAHEDDIPF